MAATLSETRWLSRHKLLGKDVAALGQGQQAAHQAMGGLRATLDEQGAAARDAQAQVQDMFATSGARFFRTTLFPRKYVVVFGLYSVSTYNAIV